MKLLMFLSACQGTVRVDPSTSSHPSDEVPAGSPRAISVFRGPLQSTDLTASDADLVFSLDHEEVSSYFGIALAAADTNGDGRAELAIGDSAWENTGAVLILDDVLAPLQR